MSIDTLIKEMQSTVSGWNELEFERKSIYYENLSISVDKNSNAEKIAENFDFE